MMIAIAASCSYMTPLEPACMLVYGPGRYKFMDFVRVGTPLTVIVFGVALTLVPLIWPL
jgi:di/tricarboxylate transporter